MKVEKRLKPIKHNIESLQVELCGRDASDMITNYEEKTKTSINFVTERLKKIVSYKSHNKKWSWSK